MKRTFLIIKHILFTGIIIAFLVFMITLFEKDAAEYNNALQSGGYRTIEELNIDMIEDMQFGAFLLEEYGTVENSSVEDEILYVKDTMPQLSKYACYCEWVSNGTTTEAKEYIIQLGDGSFIGFRTEDWNAVESCEMEILAKVERMGDSQWEFYDYAYALTIALYPEYEDQYRDFYELPEEIQNQFHDYVLVPMDEVEYVVFPRIMQFIFVLLIIVAVTNCIYNIYRDDIRIWFRKQKNKDQYASWENEKDKERLESFLNHTEDFYGVKCNKEFLYGRSKKNIVFVETKDIIEIQLRKYVYRIYYFIPIGVEWDIIIILNDEDTREISVGGKKRTQEVFDYILHNLNFKEERISDKYVKVIGRPLERKNNNVR